MEKEIRLAFSFTDDYGETINLEKGEKVVDENGEVIYERK